MPLPTNQFKEQARRAGRTISWRLEAGMVGFFATLVGLIGVFLIPSNHWQGISALALALVIAGYAIRRDLSSAQRDLICPTCGVSGEIVKVENSYQFRCSRCNQAADTGVSASGV
ncbi:MAG TPA: hypothetical protein VH255_07520 [Verrucomicrobiae bacterium]|nr:hypothetical protein [Verrucomicrobiae bacterium]